MAFDVTTQQGFDYQEWLDDQQTADDLQTLDDILQELQEQTIDEVLQEIDPTENLDFPDVDVSSEDLTDISEFSEDEGVFSDELGVFDDFDDSFDYEDLVQDFFEDSYQDQIELEIEPKISSEFEYEDELEANGTEELLEEQIILGTTVISHQTLEEIDYLNDFEEISTTDDLEDLDNDNLEDFDDLEEIKDLESLEEQNIPTELEEVEELEDIEETQDLVDLEELNDFEAYEQEESLEELDEIPQLDDLEDFVEPEDVEDIVDSEEVDDLEDLNDIDELEEYDELEDMDKEDLIGDDEFDRVEDEEDLLDELNERDDIFDYEEALKDINNIEEEVDNLETPEKVDYLDPIPEDLNFPLTEEEEGYYSSQVESDHLSSENYFDDYLELRADLHLLDAQLQPEWIQSPETITTSDLDSIPSPQPFGVSLDESTLPFPLIDEDDDFLTSLEEQLSELNILSEQWYDSTEDILNFNSLQTVPPLEENLDLIWEGPVFPEPPPYDFLAELEAQEDLEEQAIIQQLSNPLYPYNSRKRLKRPLGRTQQKKAGQEVNKIVAHSDSTHSPEGITDQRSTPDQPTLDQFIQPQQGIHEKSVLKPLTDLTTNNESSIVPPEETTTPTLEKLNVPKTRGVVKEQKEALSKLESLSHIKVGATRIITLEASSREEMGEVLLRKMGDFTYESDVKTYDKRSLVKLTKEGNWKPMRDFIKYNRVEKEVYNPTLDKTDWVVYNIKKGWEYTGNQRLEIQVDIPLLNAYKTRLEDQARTLAADSEPTRVYLSQIARKSELGKESTEYQETLSFWMDYGYVPISLQPTQVYLDHQQKWTVTHIAIPGTDIFVETINSGRLDNHTMGELAKAWEKSHPKIVEASKISIQSAGRELPLNEILPKDLVNDLHDQRTDINSLDENKGGTEVFKLQLQKIRDELQEDVANPLSDYLGIAPDTVKEAHIITSWGDTGPEKTIDADVHEFRYTFGPDIVVTDVHGNVIAVIQLKGRTQNQYSATATSSTIQIIELTKYHIEHDVPVALVNIKQTSDGLRYEWLVIGRANSRPTPLMRKLISPSTGLDPIVPRNARSRAFVQSLFQKIRSHKGTFDLKRELNKFQEVVNESQLNFQKLRFYKSIHKSLDVEKYWNKLARKAEEQGLSNKKILDFKKFYQKWKKMVVKDYIEELKDLE